MQGKRQKAKGKRQKFSMTAHPTTLLPFDFCLLPFALEF